MSRKMTMKRGSEVVRRMHHPLERLVDEVEVLWGEWERLDEWLRMSPSDMRLRCGEMTAQEIRTVKAVLKNIRDGQ